MLDMKHVVATIYTISEIQMSYKNSMVRARVNDELKHEVEGILSGLGITMSDAINALVRLN